VFLKSQNQSLIKSSLTYKTGVIKRGAFPKKGSLSILAVANLTFFKPSLFCRCDFRSKFILPCFFQTKFILQRRFSFQIYFAVLFSNQIYFAAAIFVPNLFCRAFFKPNLFCDDPFFGNAPD